MSGSTTVQESSSKCNWRSNDSSFAAVGDSAANGSAVDGGFAATPDAAENTKKMETISQLSVALVLKVNFIKLLPIASCPFLTPLAESALCGFASHFYGEEKAKEMKCDPKYISSSATKLGTILQAMPEVQESQGFKALRNDLTTELEKFGAMITQEYDLRANDLNVDAKRGRYHASICKWIQGLAQAFIVQQNIYKYNKDITVLDLIACNQDDILFLLGIPLPKFLAAYKEAHNLQRIPTPTINFNVPAVLDQIKSTTPLGAEAAPPGAPPRPGAPFTPGNGALVIIIGGNYSGSQDDKEEARDD
jgi:hypothetical protein